MRARDAFPLSFRLRACGASAADRLGKVVHDKPAPTLAARNRRVLLSTR